MTQSYNFKIVLLHEDLVSGIRGTSVLDHLACQLEMAPEQLDTEIWKFAVLRDPDMQAQAAAELMQANMIIISATGRADLPDHVREMIEKALSLRQERDAAIVALLDWQQTAAHELPRLGLYLNNLAAKSGLDFFCNKGESPFCPAGRNDDGRFMDSSAAVPWNS